MFHPWHSHVMSVCQLAYILLPATFLSQYACLALARVMQVKHNNLSMLTPTPVSSRHECHLCLASGVATLIEDIVSQVAVGDRGAASEVQSTSLLLLGPPGAGKLTIFAHQVLHRNLPLMRVFSDAGPPKQCSASC
jgi:hypothetical protein